MTIKRYGTVVWQGGLKDGKGEISTESGALKSLPYSFSKRFEDEKGTNPEELIGAAHASCFSMALSKILGDAGMKADRIETKSEVSLAKAGDAFEIPDIHLTVTASIPGADEAKFKECAEKAKAGCPVSKLLKAKITMDATLER